MSNHRNAVLVGLAAACLVFITLAIATHLPTLVALVIAIFGGGLVLAAAVSRRSPPLPPDPFPLPVSAPAPPPVQFQERPVTGVRLPSAFADYTFAFAAKVVWRPATNSVAGAGEIAVQEIIHRACGITERRDPSQVTLIASELAMALRELQSDPNEQVHFRAEGVQLQLSLEDQQRLDEATTLRKQEGLWEYQRRQEASKRRYLRTDVLKDSGSAVVWWLAKNEDQPQQVAENINVLTRLAQAANNADNADDVAPGTPAAPQTSAEHFDAFLASLDPVPNDDVRLTLTRQVARLVDGHDQKTAEDMRRRTEPDSSDIADDYWDYRRGQDNPLSE
jgi:hypothetical protein